jgi:LmbE family N-acetylglucosaminyl deacetylase/glycosyltransferase involved in cell wall biosynthesis
MSTEIPEHALIPFESADLLGNRVLVIAPHPDDETFGCGGSLALHRAHGDPVTVIFLTSGEAGDWSGERSAEQTRLTREAEAGRALAELGIDAWEFWRYADRGVTVDGELVGRLTEAIGRLGPTLVYAPSPLDLNPDHRAAARALRGAVRGAPGQLAVAFLEVAVPLPVNALVDVSSVWPTKERAMRAYPSQLAAAHDYAGVVTGLARFRSLTIEGATHVEALRVVDAAALDADPVWRWAALQSPPAPAGEPAVSVILRTRDRPAQLREALDSLADQNFRDFEVVVVNDGGADVAAVLADYPTLAVRHVRSPERLGRGASVNTGVGLARGEFIAHLDDDDVFYPEHLELLHGVLVRNRGFAVAYTDVDVARFGWNDTTFAYQLISRLPEFGRDFDADSLLYENYIPNLAVMHTREAWDRVGGFDPEIDLVGDWDFLVRLAAETQFVHVARRTAEYRIHYGGSLSSLRPWGQPDELRAREAMFHRHRERYDPEVQLRVFHDFKRRMLEAELRRGEQTARIAAVERELARVTEELDRARADAAGAATALKAAQAAMPSPPPSSPEPSGNGGPPGPSLTEAQRRRVAVARVAGAVRHPSRAVRWGRAAVESPRSALERLRGG